MFIALHGHPALSPSEAISGAARIASDGAGWFCPHGLVPPRWGGNHANRADDPVSNIRVAEKIAHR